MLTILFEKFFGYRISFFFFLFLAVGYSGYTQDLVVCKGVVQSLQNREPVPYATVYIKELKVGTVTDFKGFFSFQIPKGDYDFVINCLGYKTIEQKVAVTTQVAKKAFFLQSESFQLDNVIVTAKRNNKEVTTAYVIDNNAIEHTQLSSLGGMLSLLPGERTKEQNLLYAQPITLRSNSGEEDNPSFGAAVEVDGIRLSNNGIFNREGGVDARIVSPENIAKVEIITGIPSVKYGDLTSGVVKVKTKRGVMPLNIKMAVSPRQKLVALSQGVALGKKGGVLNLSYDYTKSIFNLVSPYTSYIRNAFTLHHSKVFFSEKGNPFSINSTLAGNFGGYNADNDPDALQGTYVKKNAFNIRGGVNLLWKVNTKLLSDIKFAANINYSDKKYEKQTKESSASGGFAFHGTEAGYFVGQPYNENEPLAPIQLLKRGHWFQQQFVDEKPLNYAIKLNFKKNLQLGHLFSKFDVGVNFTGSGNEGKGVYYGNRAYTPDWREHRYDEEPYLHNLVGYVEGDFTYSFANGQSLKAVCGLREDKTFVKYAKYSDVSAISPRFNFEYTIFNNTKKGFIKNLSLYGGWGKAVKLPSYGRLYIRPNYRGRLSFVPASLADGTTFYAYHIQPNRVIANKNLEWQYNKKWEVGLRGKYKGMSFSLVYFRDKGYNHYMTSYDYEPFNYYLTTPYQLENVKIPYENRRYRIDNNGTVTVYDKTASLPNEILDKKEKHSFNAVSYSDNGSPVKREGFEWVINLGELKPLHTSLRLDGKFYRYERINRKVLPVCLGDNQLMSSGQHYEYIGYYYGGGHISNGERTRVVSSNATLVTHVPKLRLVVSLKIEGTFMNYEQRLSEMPNGERAFELDKQQGYIPKENRGSIYDGNNFTGMYPLYYTSFKDMKTKIPFREKYLWAYEHDRTLFNDLTKMVVTSNNDFFFKPQKISPYFSANIKVSKEIGNHIKLSFFAINFLNTMQQIKDKRENKEYSLYDSRWIVPFSYGMSLKIKI